MNNSVVVYGAYGHTGKFVVAELVRQGFKPILSGRDKNKLADISKQYPNLITQTANINDPQSLDNAFSGASVIVNCAGPYLDTAEPIIESAIRLKIHYIDLTAEQKAVLNVYEKYSEKAKQADLIVIPAVGFYGGLGDLLSTSVTQGWKEVDDIKIYIGLDSWHPTEGTIITGQRNTYQRFELNNGKLHPLEAVNPFNWDFPMPIGIKEMIAVTLSEIVTISKHLNVINLKTFLSKNSIDDIKNEHTPRPKPIDGKNRSSQQFCMQVVATKNRISKTIFAKGQDIYAVTAPLIVEAIKRILSGNFKIVGVTSLGQIFDAADFLKSLSIDDITNSENEEC